MSKTEQEIINRIKDQMKMKNFTQEKLAQCLGLKQYNISRMLEGKPFPSIDQLNAICEHLDCSIHYILGLRNEAYSDMSDEAAKIAHAYVNSQEVIQLLVKRVLNIDDNQ